MQMVFATCREFGSSVVLGEARPAQVQAERDACAERFKLIGEGASSVAEGVGTMFLLFLLLM